MGLTQEQRDKIVAEAHTWVGTPYRGWSCMKGCGADCGQLLYGIYRNCGLLPELNLPKDYSIQVAQHRASTEYVDLVAAHMREITEAEVLPGDVVLYKLGLAYAHGGLIVSWPEYVIHAIAHSGVVAHHAASFKRAARRFFTLKTGGAE